MTKNTEWLSPEGLADEWDIPVATVYAWRYKGTGPRAHKIGRHVRYRRSDIDEWLEAHAEPQTAA